MMTGLGAAEEEETERRWQQRVAVVTEQAGNARDEHEQNREKQRELLQLQSTKVFLAALLP